MKLKKKLTEKSSQSNSLLNTSLKLNRVKLLRYDLVDLIGLKTTQMTIKKI